MAITIGLNGLIDGFLASELHECVTICRASICRLRWRLQRLLAVVAACTCHVDQSQRSCPSITGQPMNRDGIVSHASLSRRTPAAVTPHCLCTSLQTSRKLETPEENMTSSRSFYVDALILGKHRHQHHHHQQQKQQHQKQQLQQQQPATRNDDMMLQLPLLHQSLMPSLSHSALSLYPYIASSGSSSPEFRRGIELGTVRNGLPPPLSCLATSTGLPTCLCPFCLPLTATVGTSTPATSSPTHERLQTNIESVQDKHALTASPTAQRRRGWQPWLQQAPAAAADTQPLQSAPTNTELADRLQNHQLTVTGECCFALLMLGSTTRI